MTLQPFEIGASRADRGLAAIVATSRIIAAACVAVLLFPLVFGSAPAIAKSKKKSPAGANAELRKRVRQLEEQLLDMQVMIGTLQSMSRSGGARAPMGPVQGGSVSDSKMRQLETQIQALTAQVQRLSNRLNGRRGDAGGVVAAPERRYAGSAASSSPQLRSSAVPYQAPPPAATTTVAGFGSTTVTPSAGRTLGRDGIADYLARDQAPAASSARRRIVPGGGDPKDLYETAYGYLLQQNFGSAQTAFSDFLDLYPNDPLAGNAQYWLGETYYVRSKYRSAAKAFLKGYRTYRRSSKAPDSLLKLAMSFDRLGQKEAACSSYGELKAKFPRAPSHVKNRAQSEAKRLGC